MNRLRAIYENNIEIKTLKYCTCGVKRPTHSRGKTHSVCVMPPETGFTTVASEDDDEWPSLVCGEPFMLKTTTSGQALFYGEPFMLKTTTSGQALFAASRSC